MLTYDPAIMMGSIDYWFEIDNGHHGVWTVKNPVTSLVIPFYSPNPIRIWLQVAYDSDQFEKFPPIMYCMIDDPFSYTVMNLIETKPVDSFYSIGVYSIHIDASSRIFLRPRDCWVKIDSMIVETQPIVGDIDQNKHIDLDDLSMITDHWLQPPGTSSTDLNGDNIVNGLDLALFCENWLVEIASPMP